MLSSNEVLIDHELDGTILYAFKRLLQRERRRVIATNLRRNCPTVVARCSRIAINRARDRIAGLAESCPCLLELDRIGRGYIRREQSDCINRENGLVVVDENAQSCQFRIGKDRDWR